MPSIVSMDAAGLTEQLDGMEAISSDKMHGVWFGVSCSKRHPSRVVALDFESLDLHGQIPSCISNLTFVTRIHLPNNKLSGQIPTELGQLSRLQYLNLSSNNLGGKIPGTLPSCSRLQIIDLALNSLSGSIPEGLGTLTSLSILRLTGNNLMGNIPLSLGSSSSLISVILTNNSLTGPIPPLLANSSSLQENNLSGPIPGGLGRCKNLEALNLSSNSFHGSIPIELFTLLSLSKGLDLSHNQLSGNIPPEISGLINLGTLSISNNQFSGKIPSTLGRYGSVYRARFESEEHTVAVKVFKLDQLGAPKSFLAECKALRNTRHRNLLYSLARCFYDSLHHITEYGLGNKLSTEGDVYSYGIMILEMLTGKRPTDEMFTNGLNLYEFVRKTFPQKIVEVLDPCIVPIFEDGYVHGSLNHESHVTAGSCIMQLVKVGLSCSMEIPKDRPKMEDVYAEVITIKEAFAAICG
ncbi:hypothetical protein PR202_ga15081 [Eleusine coracana subsp. coracana]|uniref:Protein kinase domain-containing protein n=1 Tax=Eleusine coracana subsp. coracana TaxID=191504 RepID=A0AAV5CJB7_ELECO|nr:hypothetical protein PR202_ga15081 [Eleusine coracana subsp. coracana]